jgi:hypothetical protein
MKIHYSKLLIATFFIVALSFNQSVRAMDGGGGACVIGAANNIGTLNPGNTCASAVNIGTLGAACPCDGATITPTQVSGTMTGATASSPYVFQQACDGTGGDMASPAGDVWYRVTVSGPELTLNFTSSLSQVNIGLYTGGCAGLTAIGCHQANTGNTTYTTANVTNGDVVYIQISGASTSDLSNFGLTLTSNRGCTDCVRNSTLTVDPPPTSGVYAPGTTVEFCLDIYEYSQVNTNWMHNVDVSFGAGWNMGSLSITGTPSACGTTTGSWGWEGAWTDTDGGSHFGWGWDTGTNGPQDNFGDNCSCVGAGCTTPIWTFCLEITTDGSCVSGEDLTVSFATGADGEHGSWRDIACENDADYVAAALSQCTLLDDAILPLSARKGKTNNSLYWSVFDNSFSASTVILERTSGNSNKWEIVYSAPYINSHYVYEDNTFRNDVNFYRVKLTTSTGLEYYSKIVSINNFKAAKTLVKVYNIFGQEVPLNEKGMLIHVYDDGTIEKHFVQ